MFFEFVENEGYLLVINMFLGWVGLCLIVIICLLVVLVVGVMCVVKDLGLNVLLDFLIIVYDDDLFDMWLDILVF